MSAILFLAHRIPYPPDRGDKIRSFNIVKRLADIAPVHIAAFADDDADAGHEAGLRAALGSKLAGCYVEKRTRSKAFSVLAGLAGAQSASMAAFSSGSMRRHVVALLAREDIGTVFVFSGQMGQYVPDKLEKSRFVMDFVDVDSAKFESYARDARGPLRWLYSREGRVLAREERAIAERASVSLFVTEAEAGVFRSRTGVAAKCVRALENGVDLDYFDPVAAVAPLRASPGKPLIVFTGQMDYAPNVQAVSSFAREVTPRIRQAAPGAIFAIVGRGPTPAVEALGDLDGVVVVGAVPDTRPWLAAADVVVAPLQVARGVQNKVLEAMAMGRPVVASSAAFEGIDAAAGRELLVADDAGPLAAAVLSLVNDRALADGIGRAARARMCERYAWDRQLAGLADLVSA